MHREGTVFILDPDRRCFRRLQSFREMAVMRRLEAVRVA
jgi:diphthamide synthase subunit DPH2